MTTTDANIAKVHVTRSPDVCGGKPCIAGTRIRVWDIYVWHEMHRASPAEIVAEFPTLTLGDVHAALAYFWDHELEVRDEMRRVNEMVQDLRQNVGRSKLDAYRGSEVGDASKVSP